MISDVEMEASSIFNMLDPLNKGELHIKQINDLLLKVDKLGIEPEIIPPIETVDKKPDTDLQGSQRESQRFIITKTSRKNTIRKKSVIKAQSEVQMPKMYRNSSLPNSPRLDEPLIKPESPAKNEIGSFQYNSFANRKKLIRRDEFTTLYEGNLVHQSIQDEVLLKCFSAFDYDKQGYLDSKMIKEIFGLFDEKVSQMDMEILFKYLGCSGDKMTFQEFCRFFKRNL